MRSIERSLEKLQRERAMQRNKGASDTEQDRSEKQRDFGNLSAYLVTVLEPKSLVTEQFKRLRTQIVRKMKARMENVLMVTSATSGEGKTTTALNLASSISLGINDSVLMVDADLRKPGVHNFLGINADRGLVDYLRGEAELSDVLVKTGIPKLTLLPSGVPPVNPSELLSSERMTKLIQELKIRYQNRFVILDTSPVNIFADASILAPQVGGILLVVKDGDTPKDYVLRALSQLDRDRILGITLNMISVPESLQNDYYYYYNHDQDYYSLDQK